MNEHLKNQLCASLRNDVGLTVPFVGLTDIRTEHLFSDYRGTETKSITGQNFHNETITWLYTNEVDERYDYGHIHYFMGGYLGAFVLVFRDSNIVKTFLEAHERLSKK